VTELVALVALVSLLAIVIAPATNSMSAVFVAETGSLMAIAIALEIPRLLLTALMT
jgi:hypothetical protein